MRAFLRSEREGEPGTPVGDGVDGRSAGFAGTAGAAGFDGVGAALFRVAALRAGAAERLLLEDAAGPARRN